MDGLCIVLKALSSYGKAQGFTEARIPTSEVRFREGCPWKSDFKTEWHRAAKSFISIIAFDEGVKMTGRS